MLEHLNKRQKVTPSALDAVEMLMLSHAKTLKTFSKRRQAIAKKRIAEIIVDLEIEQIDENENNQQQATTINYPSTMIYQPVNEVVDLPIENSSYNLFKM